MATSKRQRVFAAFGAVLFFVTASALTIAVVYDMVTGQSDTSTNSTALTSDAATASTCETSASIETTVKLGAPDIYKPTADVTELETTDLVAGDGATAAAGDCLQVKYYGTLASDGTKFDDNFGVNTLFQFQLGAGQVISGWDQGLIGMKEGGTRRLVIPSDLAYGESGGGSIPANADLVFVVRLESIE